jgi:chemotaxis protein histidine kinase CheA
MGSQTKVEPTEGASASTPSAPASGATDARGYAGDADQARESGDLPAMTDAAMTDAAMTEAGLANDDEDVSLDELMISDSADSEDEEDEQEEATDVHQALNRGAFADDADEAAPLSGENVDVSDSFEPEDDEAASLAAAAAAQEEAAQAAESERALALAAQRGPAAARMAAEEARAAEDVAAREAQEEQDAEAVFATEAAADALQMDAADMAAETPRPGNVSAEQSEGLGGPLPSFDIPDPLAAANSRRALLAVTPVPDSAPATGRVSPRPMAPFAPLSEIAEDDDDDAVTHIGLPVPEAANDYPELGSGGFHTLDPVVAVRRDFDPNASLGDARRATTRVVQRIDPELLDSRQSGTRERSGSVTRVPPLATSAPPTTLGTRLSRLASSWMGSSGSGGGSGRRGWAWVRDSVLPPVSLVLFGSGLGAGIMLLQTDRGAASQSQRVQALQETPGKQVAKRPQTLSERAEGGDGDALFKITNMNANERTSVLTLALETGYQAQKLNEFNEFAASLRAPSASAAPNAMGRFMGYAISPETMLPAFRQLSELPGSRGPDVLFAVWEKAPGGSRSSTLAHQLLHSTDQRAKATPSLLTALDLRAATSCEDYLRLLPAVLRDGDQRCSATLRALKHTDGCGDDGQQDCYPCLREGRQLDQALEAIEKRPPPAL